MKSILAMTLVLSVVFCFFAMPVQAAYALEEPEEAAYALEEPEEEPGLLEVRYLSRSECKAIYQEMIGYSFWSTVLLAAIGGLPGTGWVAALVAQLYFGSVQNELYKGGYVSGYTGVVVYIYDNAVPGLWAY